MPQHSARSTSDYDQEEGKEEKEEKAAFNGPLLRTHCYQRPVRPSLQDPEAKLGSQEARKPKHIVNGWWMVIVNKRGRGGGKQASNKSTFGNMMATSTNFCHPDPGISVSAITILMIFISRVRDPSIDHVT